MAIHDLYSDRRKREIGDVPDVFVYDTLPEKLRCQIACVLKDTFGEVNQPSACHAYIQVIGEFWWKFSKKNP